MDPEQGARSAKGSRTIEQIARAFSGHRFAEAAPSLREDVRWDLVGGELLSGRDAVLARCRATAAALTGVAAAFERFGGSSAPTRWRSTP
jgi:hypothetical protein